jgi:hypothetical protein
MLLHRLIYKSFINQADFWLGVGSVMFAMYINYQHNFEQYVCDVMCNRFYDTLPAQTKYLKLEAALMLMDRLHTSLLISSWK